MEPTTIHFGPKDEEVKVTHRYIIVYDSDEDTSEVDLVDQYEEEIETPNISMDEIATKFKILKEHISLGTLRPGQKVDLIFPYEGDASIIERTKPGCSCTVNLAIDPINKVLKGTFDSKGMKGAFSKTISVFFKDGVKMEVRNSLGVLVENAAKSKIKLNFNGMIR